jgi:hypothetical protein
MSERRISRKLRKFVADRANHCCEYFLSPVNFSSSPFCVDHFRPRIAHGTNAHTNLVLACPGCNLHKHAATSAIDPVTGVRVRLFNPRQDDRGVHFAWSDDYLILVGRTPVGRATIQRLQLNRPQVTNIRRLLRSFGLHPPTINHG